MAKTALITGASGGIGAELARCHAARGGNLILVARSEDKLGKLRRELEAAHAVRVTVVPADLSREEAPRELHAKVQEPSLEVDYLINNAGFGGRGAFHERAWEKDRTMIQLNVVALAALTRLFLPRFVERGSGRILNVSSTASLMPGPLQAVYFASKAFVTSFSNALAEELRDTGVTVTALLPGATDTGFARTADLEKTSLFSSTASAAKVAQDGYEGMLAGKLNVITGVSMARRASLAALPFAPRRMVLREVRKMQEAAT